MTKTARYQILLGLQLLVVLTAIFGSLFFSDVMKFAPCDLCWWQRICIYPMALILLTGFYLQSRDTVRFLIPFTVVGLGISIYHNLVYYKFITVITPCMENAPCTAQHINWLGFITIPLLSLMAFITLLVLSSLTLSSLKKDSDL